ncbi:NB-ARC domain-containing protein [Acaryochloris sp. IP29b_bin.148]|uniref:WD40 domain-containing protein n=1 Tax=Acaryochloris sp. IP29b_bin.148 TaxID=2969218 RepID=UPI002618D1AC|nr:NB-ARC domain-containing protein [Acaryochloris sp. IP29b_bin.148]
MPESVQASQAGLALVEQARRRKRWNKTAQQWCQAAYTSRSTLNRFWAGQAIRMDTFMAICTAVGVDWQTVAMSEALQEESFSLPAAAPSVAACQDWGDAPTVDSFRGRAKELTQLTDWIVQDRCHLVLLLGMGGIGKTLLASKIARTLADQFDKIIWRSLRNAPPLIQVVLEFIQFLSDRQSKTLPAYLDGQLLELLKYLRQSRCLIILDNVESILASCDRTGRYRDGYEDYGQLFQCIGQADHQSCLLLTSREQPQGVLHLDLHAKSLALKGLPLEVAQDLLAAKGEFSASRTDWNPLIEHYAGNPLALNIVRAAIRDYFDQDINQFLTVVQTSPFIFDDIRDLLSQQFQRLPALEQSILYWLGINRVPSSLADLQADGFSPQRIGELIQALNSLQRRSLIEKLEVGYTLQPVVMEYVVSQLIDIITAEIVHQTPQLLRSHAVLKVQARDYIREAQLRFIVQPIAERVVEQLVSVQQVETHIRQILQSLQGKPANITGYVAGNCVNLLRQLKVDLRGYDFSRLTLWQANLQNLNLPEVNLTGSDLSRSQFTEMTGNVLSAAFSPDGEALATCDNAYTVRLWDVKTGQLLVLYQGHTHWIRSVAFPPTETGLLASGGADGTVRLWDRLTGQCLQILTGHQEEVFSVAFSADGQQLASGSGDHTIKIWDVACQRCQLTLSQHQGRVRAVAFRPQGHLLASGSEDHTIKLWDTATGQCLQTLTGHTDWVRSLAFSADGQYLASASNDGTVRCWAMATGLCSHIFTDHQGGVYTVAFNPQDHTLASGGSDHQIKLWDAETGSYVGSVYGHHNQIFALAFSPDGQALACVSLDQTVKLWDWRTPQCLNTWQSHTDWAFPISLSDDGAVVVSGNGDHRIKLWDFKTGQLLKTLDGHATPVRAVALNSRHILAVAAAENAVRLWQWQSGNCVQTLVGHKDWVLSAHFNPAGDRLVTGSADHTVRIWQWQTGQCQHCLQGHTDQVVSVAFCGFGKYVISGSADHTVKIWDPNTGDCLQTLKGHQTRIYDVAFAPFEEEPLNPIAASGSGDGTVRLWNVNTGTCLQTLIGHKSWVFSVAFSPDRRMLVTGSHDQTVRLWDLVTGTCLHTLLGHQHQVFSVAFHPDGDRVLSGSQDQTIRVWDVKTGTCLQVLSDRLYEGMDITEVRGLTTAQRTTLIRLGAVSSHP